LNISDFASFRLSGHIFAGVTATRSITALAASFLLGLGCILQAQAANHESSYDYCLPNGETIIAAHVVGNTDKDTPDNQDFLSDWFDIPHNNGWTCTRYSNQASARTLKTGLYTAVPGHHSSIRVDGEQYDVYLSPSGQAVGFIMRNQLRINTGSVELTSGWQPVTNATANREIKMFDLSLPAGSIYTVSVDSRVRLLKLGRPKNYPIRGQAIDFEVAHFKFYSQNIGAQIPGAPPLQTIHSPSRAYRYSRVNTWFNREHRSCSTPSSELFVLLPPVPKSAFNDVHSTAGNTSFTLELTDCKPDTASIKYKLIPSYLETRTAPVANAANGPSRWLTTHTDGTLPLSGLSTASGVGVQVLHKNGQVVKFDGITLTPFNGFTKGDTTARIQLQAQYIQTGPTITAGSVFATMTVLYMYQ